MESLLMAKASSRNPNINQIFEDLDSFKDFCREYGYAFNERDLYSQRSYIWRQYQKMLAGKTAKNQWEAFLNPSRRA